MIANGTTMPDGAKRVLTYRRQYRKTTSKATTANKASGASSVVHSDRQSALDDDALSCMRVCRVDYDLLDVNKIAHVELARDSKGRLKHLMKVEKGRFYDVEYFNAELNKTIALGRFTDSCTASLAHGLARTNLKCRTVDFAAQGFIERLFTQGNEHAFSKGAMEFPHDAITVNARDACLMNGDEKGVVCERANAHKTSPTRKEQTPSRFDMDMLFMEGPEASAPFPTA